MLGVYGIYNIESKNNLLKDEKSKLELDKAILFSMEAKNNRDGLQKKLDGLKKENNIIGIGSTQLTQKDYQESIKKSLKDFLASEEYDSKNLDQFLKIYNSLQFE